MAAHGVIASPGFAGARSTPAGSAESINRRRDAGFTLIEVMIAVLLTAIAVIGAMALFRINSSASGLTRHQTEASVLAEDKLEALRTVASPTAAATITESTLNEQGVTVSGGRYTRVSTIAASNDVYALQVVVSWDEDGTTKSVTVRGRR